MPKIAVLATWKKKKKTFFSDLAKEGTLVVLLSYMGHIVLVLSVGIVSLPSEHFWAIQEVKTVKKFASKLSRIFLTTTLIYFFKLPLGNPMYMLYSFAKFYAFIISGFGFRVDSVVSIWMVLKSFKKDHLVKKIFIVYWWVKKEYEHVPKDWDRFGIKRMKDYRSLYLKWYVLVLCLICWKI